jgi:hypothetical protein
MTATATALTERFTTLATGNVAFVFGLSRAIERFAEEPGIAANDEAAKMVAKAARWVADDEGSLSTTLARALVREAIKLV